MMLSQRLRFTARRVWLQLWFPVDTWQIELKHNDDSMYKQGTEY